METMAAASTLFEWAPLLLVAGLPLLSLLCSALVTLGRRALISRHPGTPSKEIAIDSSSCAPPFAGNHHGDLPHPQSRDVERPTVDVEMCCGEVHSSWTRNPNAQPAHVLLAAGPMDAGGTSSQLHNHRASFGLQPSSPPPPTVPYPAAYHPSMNPTASGEVRSSQVQPSQEKVRQVNSDPSVSLTAASAYTPPPGSYAYAYA